jgi:hypothetical protein
MALSMLPEQMFPNLLLQFSFLHGVVYDPDHSKNKRWRKSIPNNKGLKTCAHVSMSLSIYTALASISIVPRLI